MAGSATVGILRVLLTANSAEFDATMKRVADSAKTLSKDLGGIGKQATAVGSALTRTITVPLVALGAGAIKAAMDFESSFAGVKKTLTITHGVADEVFAGMAQGLRDMAKEIPVNVNELNKIAEAAGQLGVGQDDILDFTKTMAMLGVTTNVTADEAATAIASIQNIFGGGREDTDRFASALVALGNSGASTEKDILAMSQRIAKAGSQVGLTQGQVMAFASSLSGIGIEAEAGGSAMQRVFLKINDAVMSGGKDLDEFARVAGTSSEKFATAFRTNAADATVDFIAGLKRIQDEGENTNATIEGLMGKNIILKSTLMGAAGAVDQFRDNLKLQADAWRENTALTKEAEIRFGTVKNQLILLANKAYDVAITVGKALMPAFTDLMTAVTPVVAAIAKAAEWFGKLPQPVRVAVAGFVAFAAAIGPVTWAFGTLTTAVSVVIGAFAKKGIAMRVLTGAYPALTAAIGGTAAAVVGIGALFVALGAALYGVGRAVVDLYTHWKAGGSMWAFFSARDDDNFVRRWLGLSGGLKTAATGMDAAAQSAADLKERIGGKGLANDVAVLDQVLKDLTATGKTTPGELARIKTEVQLLEARGAELTPTLQAVLDSIKPIKPAAAEASKEVDKFAESLKDLGGADALAGAKEVVKQLGALGGPLKVLPSQLDSLADKLREGAAAALMLGKSDLAAQYEMLARTLSPTIQFQQRWNVTIGEYVLQAKNAETATELLDAQINELGRTVTSVGPILQSTMTDAMKGLGGFASGTTLSFPPFKVPVIPEIPESAKKRIAKELKTELADIFKSIPSTISQALVSGGGLGNAASAIASQLGSNLAKSVALALGVTGPFGMAVAGAVGALAPMISKLWGGNSEHKQVNDLRDKFVSAAGGIHELNVKAQAAGMTLDRLLKAKTVKDFEAAVAELNKGFERQGEILEENAKLLEENKKHASDLFSEIMTAGSEGIPAAYRPAIEQLIALGLLTDEQAAKLRGMGDATGPNVAKMTAAMDVFKGRVESLGPAFKQAQISETAAKYVNAIQTMIDGGGDVGGVLFDAREELGALVEESMKSGTTLPANLKPWIDDLVRSGNLVDANGKKITDVSKLKFGEPIKTEAQIAKDGWDKILAAIQSLIDKITGPLTKAITDIPDRTIKIGADTTDLDRVINRDSPNKGFDTGFATGTMGRFGKWFGDFGAGMRSTLHGVEAVLRPQDAVPFSLATLGSMMPAMPSMTPAFAGMGGGGNTSSTVNNYIIVPVPPDAVGDAYSMTRAVISAVPSSVEMNEGGIRDAIEKVYDDRRRTYGR